MASIYKNASHVDDDSDSDASSSVSEQSSSTLQGDNVDATNSEDAPTKTTSKLAQLPTELRNRVLMLTSRGVSFRHRHLLTDLHALLPHTYKDTKLDTKSNNHYNAALNSLADLHSCNYIFFLEGRKNGQDLYLWLAKAPNGPTIKFQVSNVHTMAELGFGGNCLKGGRGIVAFDKSFDDELNAAGTGRENITLIREMLRGVFCVPSKGVRGLKPFIDRVIGIYALDQKIWIRVYELRDEVKTEADIDLAKDSLTGGSSVKLVEVGPRMVLTPIVILEGSFGGPVIFENKLYVSPNVVRREVLAKKSAKYAQRTMDRGERVRKIGNLGLNSGAKRRRSHVDDKTLFG